MEGKAIAVINSHMDPLRRIIAALEQRYVFLGLAGSANSLQRARLSGSKFRERSALYLVSFPLSSSPDLHKFVAVDLLAVSRSVRLGVTEHTSRRV